MKSQVLHTVWCNMTGEATGEIWTWSLLGVNVHVRRVFVPVPVQASEPASQIDLQKYKDMKVTALFY